MARTLYQIGATVPRIRLRRVWLKALVVVEDQVPEEHAPALVIGESQGVFRHRVADRLQAEQVGLDGLHLVIRHQGIGGIGKCRVVAFAVLADTLVQGTEEISITPVANTGLLVRRNVGRVQRAERQLELHAAGKGFAAGHGVARDTVSRCRQVLAALDQRLVIGLYVQTQGGQSQPANQGFARMHGSGSFYREVSSAAQRQAAQALATGCSQCVEQCRTN